MNNPNYNAAKAARNYLAAQATIHSSTMARLSNGNHNAVGMTADHVKALPEWQAAYKGYQRASDALRNFNKTFTKTFAKEIREERDAQRQAKLAATV